MSALQLEPRGSAQIIDASIRLFRQHAGPFIALGIVAMLPSFVVFGVLFARMGDSLTQPGAELPPAFIALLPLTFVAALWYLLLEGAIVAAASDAYLGRPVSAAAGLRRVLSRLGPVLGSVVLKWLLMYAVAIVISLAIAIPAGMLGASGVARPELLAPVTVVVMVGIFLYLFARLFAVPATALLENNGAVAALGRASRLASGSIWRIVKVYLIAFLVLAVVSLLCIVLGAILLSAWPAAQVLLMLPYLLVYPLLSVITTVLYYDVRIRREGFDIEVMAGQMASEPAGNPA